MRNGLSSAATGLLAIALTAALGCSSSEDVRTSPEPRGVLEVFSWWTSGGEREAFDALVAEFTAKYPKVQVINAAQSNVEDARTIFEQRMVRGDPPDTFQSIAGNAVSQWVGNGGSDSKLVNLDNLAQGEGWKSVFSAEVLSAVSVNGSMYAVPINVHRINTMLYNPNIFRDNNLTAPTTISELKSVAEALKLKGIPAIGLGVKGGWTASLWIIDALFPAVAGGEQSRAFLRGELSADDPKFLETIELATELLQYTNADRDALEWNEAALKVPAGSVAMNPMGDWAYAELKVQGKKLGADFDVMVHPGSDGIYMMNYDTFPMTAGAPNPRAAEAWLKVVGSEGGQTAFNVIKGSIPARTIIDAGAYDAYGKRAVQEFAAEGTQRVNVLSAILSVPFEQDMNEQMRKFVITGDADALLTWFRDNYPRLRR